MPNEKQLVQAENQNQEMHLNQNEWEEINANQIQDDQLNDDSVDRILTRNAVTEENAKISFELAAVHGLNQVERKNMESYLNSVTPDQIDEMCFGEMVSWAKDSALIESGSPDFLMMTAKLISVDALRTKFRQNATDQLKRDIANELASLAVYANKYVISHDVWNKAFWNKGKCRLALAKKILQEQDLLLELNIAKKETTKDGENMEYLSPKYTVQSLKVERDFVNDTKCKHSIGNRIHNSDDPEKVALYKKFTEDIGGNFNRLQFMSIFQGQYLDDQFIVTEEEENQVTEALRRYYAKKEEDRDKRPLFDIIDQRAKLVLSVKYDESFFDKDKIIAEPHRAFFLGHVLPLYCADLFSTGKPLGKAYLEDLRNRDPQMAEKLDQKCALFSIACSKFQNAMISYFGLSINDIGLYAKTSVDVLKDQYQAGGHYLKYYPEGYFRHNNRILGPNEYLDEEGNVQFFEKEQYIAYMKQSLPDLV